MNDRGIVPRYIKRWLLDKYGEDGLSKVLNSLTPATAEMLRNPIPHEWYPSSSVEELYVTIHRIFAANEPEVIYSLGYHIAEKSVKGFLNFLMRLTSVDVIIKRVKSLWRKFHDSSTATGEIIEQNGTRKKGLFKVEGPSPGEYSCQIITGFLEYMFVTTGATEVKVEKKTCIHNSDPFCSWEIQFTEN